MKKTSAFLCTCLCVLLCSANLVAQSYKGDIHVKYSVAENAYGKLSFPDSEKQNWATSPVNPKFRDLYIEEGKLYLMKIIHFSGQEYPVSSYTVTSSDTSVIFSYKEKYALKGRKVTTKPVIVTVRSGNAECSIRVFVYTKNYAVKRVDNNRYRFTPDLPVEFPATCEVTDLQKTLGIELPAPRWSCKYQNERYCLVQDVVCPGAVYNRGFKLKRFDEKVRWSDPLEASGLKPGDYVVYNASKQRYEAYDGGLRSMGVIAATDISRFKNQVVGIVATVYPDTPPKATGCRGIYTSDGKKHHALVIDLRDCDRKWVFCSEEESLPNLGVTSTDRNGYELSTALVGYNNNRGASHRIKPIHWMVSRNESARLQPGTTGWYIPSADEMARTNLKAVCASIKRLVALGRSDVQQIHDGSDYWTCEANSNIKGMAWSYDPAKNVVNTYPRKRSAELFVRAVFSL